MWPESRRAGRGQRAGLEEAVGRRGPLLTGFSPVSHPLALSRLNLNRWGVPGDRRPPSLEPLSG